MSRSLNHEWLSEDLIEKEGVLYMTKRKKLRMPKTTISFDDEYISFPKKTWQQRTSEIRNAIAEDKSLVGRLIALMVVGVVVLFTWAIIVAALIMIYLVLTPILTRFGIAIAQATILTAGLSSSLVILGFIGLRNKVVGFMLNEI